MLTVGAVQYLAVAAGGAAGAMARLGLQEWVVSRFGYAFPWATLGINVIGSFLIGVLAVVLVERLQLDPVWRSLLVIGVLGGFTTFSTFSLEVVHMLDQGALARAGAYIAASVVGCVLAAAVGLLGTRALMPAAAS